MPPHELAARPQEPAPRPDGDRTLRALRSGLDRTLGAAREALATLVPVDCPACGAAGIGLCPTCHGALRGALDPVSGALDAEGRSLPIATTAPYDGVVRRLLSALKERGRTDPVAPLAKLLRIALATALASGDASVAKAWGGGVPGRGDADGCTRRRAVHPRLVLVPAPSRASTTRHRGFVPIRRICEVAVPRGAIAPWLAVRPTVRDQAGLGRDERVANLAGTMRAAQQARGARVVLVDDVVTTGATVREAVRALTEAGAEVVAVVAIARTIRRDGVEVAWVGAGAGSDIGTQMNTT